MMTNIRSIMRIFSLEIGKTFRGLSIYYILLVLVAMIGVFSSTPASGYYSALESEHKTMQSMIAAIENGTSIILGNVPEGFNTEDYPLLDNSGQVIKENADVYIKINEQNIQQKIEALTAVGGEYSFYNLIEKGGGNAVVFLVLFSMIMSVILFGWDYLNGAMRLIISRGVSRNQLLSAKILTATTLSILFALISTFTLYVSVVITYTGFDSATSINILPHMVLDIFVILFLASFAYIAMGCLITTLLASPTPAMAVGFVVCIISLLFINITPGGDSILSKISPVSLAYNFNCLLQNLDFQEANETITNITSANTTTTTQINIEVTGESQEVYRSTGLSILMILLYTSIYAGLSYYIFSRKELKP